jgi:hypothetical protein
MRIIGPKENNMGRFFVNLSFVFNDTAGVKRAAGTTYQLVQVQEEDLVKYADQSIYLQYWNGSWSRYR